MEYQSTFTITVNAKLLAAVATARSYEVVRQYLHGVHFEPNALGGINLIATDGRILTAGYDATGSMGDTDRATMPVSKKAMTELKKDKADIAVFDGKLLTVMDRFGSVLYLEPCVEIDGTFPDWRRVVPSAESEACHGSFSPLILDQATATSKILGKNVHLTITGENELAPHVVRYKTVEYAIFSVIMPVRLEGKRGLPEWLAPHS